MNNEIKAWIVIALTGLIFIADDIFSFISKGWTNLLLIIMGISFLYLLVKSAVEEALKEHNHND